MTLGLFGLELLSTLGSSKHRALHDLLAGSVVVRLDAGDDAAGLPEASGVAGVDDAEAVATTPPAAGQFACFTCGTPTNFGASHCRTCEQAFEYRNGQPVPLEPET